jgi:hypothetical protein
MKIQIRCNARTVRMNAPFPICEGGTQVKGVYLNTILIVQQFFISLTKPGCY